MIFYLLFLQSLVLIDDHIIPYVLGVGGGVAVCLVGHPFGILFTLYIHAELILMHSLMSFNTLISLSLCVLFED